MTPTGQPTQPRSSCSRSRTHRVVSELRILDQNCENRFCQASDDSLVVPVFQLKSKSLEETDMFANEDEGFQELCEHLEVGLDILQTTVPVWGASAICPAESVCILMVQHSFEGLSVLLFPGSGGESATTVCVEAQVFPFPCERAPSVVGVDEHLEVPVWGASAICPAFEPWPRWARWT